MHEMLRSACALLVLLGARGTASCETKIDAIFFVTIAPEHEVNLGDCHVSFWTISAPPDPCQHGCSAVGGARIGLNTFESSFSSTTQNLTFLMTLECSNATVTAESCAATAYPLFQPRKSLVLLKPSGAPVNLGSFTVRMPKSHPTEPHTKAETAEDVHWQAFCKLGCLLTSNLPIQSKWFCVAAYIAWSLFVALVWLVKTSYVEATLITGGSEHAALCAGGHGSPVCEGQFHNIS